MIADEADVSRGAFRHQLATLEKLLANALCHARATWRAYHVVT